MKPGPFTFVRTTTFRLALIYTLLFAVFSIGLLGFIYQATVGAMQTETKSRLESEFRTLAVAWNTGGPLRLEQSLLERSLVQVRDFTYQLETAEGRVIVGDMPYMPVDAPDTVGEVRVIRFEVERPLSSGSPVITSIEGRITRLGDRSVLLVGIKMDERLRLVGRITQAVGWAAPVGMLLALIGGIFSARYAAGRAEALTRTAEAVMAGDLSQRADIRGSGDEFDRLAERLNAMLAKLETLMASTRNAGNAIAHDLRSPLSRLRNGLEAALRGPMDEVTARETLGHTVDEVDNVLSTFNAILRLSRVNEGAEGRLVSLDFSELAGEMAELFEPACEEAGLGFKADIRQGLSIRGDHSLLGQAIANLLDNAVKYTPSGGQITFSVKPRDGDIRIEVRDTGPGIPEADYERVKERFVRLDVARTQAGSGLGLAMVDAVAELHGGRFKLSDGGGKSKSRGLSTLLILPKEK